MIIITHTENPETKIYIVLESGTHILIKIIYIYGGHKDSRKLYLKYLKYLVSLYLGGEFMSDFVSVFQFSQCYALDSFIKK